MNFGFASVAAITLICYFAAELAKVFSLKQKYIPSLMGFIGAVLGIVGYFVMNDFPATDVLTAICVGIVSGFAATGVNQVYKQLKKSE